jgi:hypothetical protein
MTNDDARTRSDDPSMAEAVSGDRSGAEAGRLPPPLLRRVLLTNGGLRSSAFALLGAALILSACGGSVRNAPPAAVREELPPAVPAGVTPLTLEQEQDSML